jgi:hypothetical protein
MAKKVWISIPLITVSEVNDPAVVGFLKGGLKKELEVETAAFLTKWMMDKSIPFGIDFDSTAVDRNLVMAALPKRLQKALGVTIPVVADTMVEVIQVEQAVPGTEEARVEETAPVTEPAVIEVVAPSVQQAPEVAAESVENAGENGAVAEPLEAL